MTLGLLGQPVGEWRVGVRSSAVDRKGTIIRPFRVAMTETEPLIIRYVDRDDRAMLTPAGDKCR
jgi:hypothetical protein